MHSIRVDNILQYWIDIAIEIRERKLTWQLLISYHFVNTERTRVMQRECTAKLCECVHDKSRGGRAHIKAAMLRLNVVTLFDLYYAYIHSWMVRDWKERYVFYPIIRDNCPLNLVKQGNTKKPKIKDHNCPS